MGITCPRNYALETIPAACAYHCPIKRGINVREKWHSPSSATAQGAPGHNKITAQALADRANKGYIARRIPGRKRLDIPFYKQDRERIPECGLIAFLLSRDANGTRKAARKGARDALRVKRLGLYQRGARRVKVLEMLEQRERHRQAIARGAIMPAPLSDSEIAELCGVSRQCVGIHKKRQGYT